MKQDAKIPYSTWRNSPGSQRSGYQLHIMRAQDPWAYEEHGHREFCEFVYTQRGRVMQFVNGEEFVQEPGGLLLIREQDVHALEGTSFVYANIMFPTAWIRRLEEYTQVTGLSRRITQPLQPPSAAIPPEERRTFEALVDELHAAHAVERGRQLFSHFLALVMGRYLVTAREASSPDVPDWLSNTLRWVHRHHDTVPSLADVIGYSCRCQEHFTREFSRHMGDSPSRYLAGVRTDRAASLLSTTNFPVREICDRTGFESESYFYRLFRQRKGMTPMAYRRAHGPRSIQKRV